MITVEIGLRDDGKVSEVVEIYFDKEGFDYLLARIEHIAEGKTDHVNLMSESWGLGDLDEQKHRDTNVIAHHLRLTLMDS